MANHRAQRGFTLVELLIVIVIMVVLGTMGTVRLLRSHRTKVLELEANRVVMELRTTASRSEAQEEGAQWGVHLENPLNGGDFSQVWYGSDYATGTKKPATYINETLVFEDDLSVAGSSKDVVFEKGTGLPLAAETITIESTEGGGQKVITINSYGKIDF